MSLLRRRMMMQAAVSEPIPRERIVFSHAGDEIVKDGLKRYDGDAICGIVILHQTYYGSPYRPYWFYMLLLTKSGMNSNAVRVSGGGAATTADGSFVGSDGLRHQRSATYWNTSFNTLEDGLERAEEININNLPILNKLTGKTYEGIYDGSGGTFICPEADADLLDYYYGVIN